MGVGGQRRNRYLIVRRATVCTEQQLGEGEEANVGVDGVSEVCLEVRNQSSRGAGE